MTNFNPDNYIMHHLENKCICNNFLHKNNNLDNVLYLDPAYTGDNEQNAVYCYDCWIDLPRVPEKYRMNEWVGIFKCCNCYEENIDLFLDPNYTGDNEHNAIYCYKCWCDL